MRSGSEMTERSEWKDEEKTRILYGAIDNA